MPERPEEKWISKDFFGREYVKYVFQFYPRLDNKRTTIITNNFIKSIPIIPDKYLLDFNFNSFTNLLVKVELLFKILMNQMILSWIYQNSLLIILIKLIMN